MLRLTLTTEEYLQLGEEIKVVFLGGTDKHLRIMIDAPKDVNVIRSRLIEKNITDPEQRAKLPKFYAEPKTPEKYRKKRIVMNDSELVKSMFMAKLSVNCQNIGKVAEIV